VQNRDQTHPNIWYDQKTTPQEGAGGVLAKILGGSFDGLVG